MIGLLLLALPQAPDTPTWRLSDPAWESALAGLGSVEPRLDLAPWPRAGGLAAWSEEAPWRAWVELLRAERAAPGRDDGSAARRTLLARAARAQGRDGAAWRLLEAARARPELLAGALPEFLPGARLKGTLAPGEPLPAGVLLAPALPPEPEEWNGAPEAEVEGFAVGDAVLGLRVLFESDGTQVDLRHRGGGPVEVRVLVPAPPGAAIGTLYVNWSEVEDPRAAQTVALSEEAPETTLWGRYVGDPAAWPTGRPEPPPERPGDAGPPGPPPVPGSNLALGGLHLVLPEGDRRFLPHRRFGEAVSELLGVPLAVSAEAPHEPDGVAPLVVHFDDPGSGKLAALVSAAERWVLGLDAR